ncbi:MAG: hypothetical protein ABS46_01400 [Cytophagaceae bacterium SCN 52-12]|nr:MAG: hypothetical protein ABS46_01400 [Cytophagaceae bacterium SCN 52-12]
MKTKVIIVDDHALFNDGLARILSESPDFEVIKQVYDSRHALFHCQELHPDLVLVDYNMPGLDGLEVVKQLRALGGDFKIVVISMYADKKEIQRFITTGVDGYLTKTTHARELTQDLVLVMKGKRVFSPDVVSKVPLHKDTFQLRFQLTKRELEILRWIKAAATTQEIADKLSLSYYTVETHRKNINQKLKSLSRREYEDLLDELPD